MIKSGKIWKYGDNINTDYIFPATFTYTLMSDQEMGPHAMEGLDVDFTAHAVAGDVIIAGKNWGCGSSREQAVKCLKARGIAAVIAKSFARIYYRNALNEGLAIIVCPDAVDAIQVGDSVSIDTQNGLLVCGVDEEKIFHFAPYPEYVQKLVKAGGLLPYIKKVLHERGKL